jgi:putative tricarboxylic transport membrane protein
LYAQALEGGGMPGFVKNPKDFFAGLMFLAIAAIFAAGVRELPMGTAFRMGPGYFPFLLILLLAGFGVVLVLQGLKVKGEPIGALPWRGILLVTLPVIFFGATLKGLGFAPSLAISTFATTLASRLFDWKTALTVTAALVALCWAIFIWGLGLPISLYGPWVGGY